MFKRSLHSSSLRIASVGEAEGDWHDLECDESNGAAGSGDEFGHQLHVGVKADADAVDEDDRGAGLLKYGDDGRRTVSGRER